MKLALLFCASMLAGCATFESPLVDRASFAHRPDGVSFKGPAYELPPVGDEIRLFDTRVLRALHQANDQQPALSLTGPQKVAIIVGASVLGVYLISEWIEDVLPPPPGL